MDSQKENSSTREDKRDQLHPDKSEGSIWEAIGGFAILIVLIFIGVFIGRGGLNSTGPFCVKNDLQSKIYSAIENGADYITVKHIFDTKELLKPTLLGQFESKNMENIYKQTITLDEVLMDLKASCFIKKEEKPLSEELVKKIDSIIQQNNEINPFDKLEEHQKYFFNNVRRILKINYPDIHNDLIKISDEMDRKNQLVNKYLANSEWSYKLSIYALLISIASPLFGLIPKGNIRRIFNKLSSSNHEKD